MFTATVTGVDKAIALNKRIIHPRFYERMMDEIMDDTVSLIRQRCPVDTGALLNTIHYIKVGEEWKIIVGDDNTPYVFPMEFGFSGYIGGTITNPKFMKTGYCPFIRPSIYEINKAFPNYIRRIIFGTK